MQGNIYKKYRETQVNTVDPGTLILMLYDGAISELNKIKSMLEQPNFNKTSFSQSVIKVNDILAELMASLNFDNPKAKPLSENLWKIYEYLMWRLMMADLKKDIRMIEEVIWHIDNLRDAWVQITGEKTIDMPPPDDDNRNPSSGKFSSLVA